MIPAIHASIIWERNNMEDLGWILFGQSFIEKKKLEASVSQVDREEGKMEVSVFGKRHVKQAQAGLEQR